MTLRKKIQAVRKYMKHSFSSVDWKRRDKTLAFLWACQWVSVLHALNPMKYDFIFFWFLPDRV